MHKYTMRPYTVFGIKYYPFIANIGDEFEGVAFGMVLIFIQKDFKWWNIRYVWYDSCP